MHSEKSARTDQSISTRSSFSSVLKNQAFESELTDDCLRAPSSLSGSPPRLPKTLSSRNLTKSFSNSSFENDYAESFEQVSASESPSEIDTLTASKTDLNLSKQTKLVELKKKNYVEYLKLKIRQNVEEETEKNSIKIAQYQISKFISRIKSAKHLNRTLDEEMQENEQAEIVRLQKEKEANCDRFRINQPVINRLDALNTVDRLRSEQLFKIENEYGRDILGSQQVDEQKRSKDAYMRMKAGKIRSRLVDEHFGQHEMHYCDSLMLIGDLARNLPKPSDPPQLIWDRLIGSLKTANT